MSEPILEKGLSVRGARKIYPGTVALDRVDLDIRPGEMVALLGENGAGKSTIANAIAGTIGLTEGTMSLDGKPYVPRSPRDALAEGVVLIHQEMRLLPDLSAAENVLVGHLPTKRGLVDTKAMRQKAQEKLDLLGFPYRASITVGSLPIAAQQQVEIAKALMYDSKILMFDEPTAALGAHEVQALFETIDMLKKKGVGLIYVSHRLEEIAQVCNRIVVLRDGKWITSHETGKVAQEVLVQEMVGREVGRLFPTFAPPREEIVLQVEGLSSFADKFRDISFQVKAGEIFGVAGIVGAGRTELVRGVAGIDAVSKGQINVAGKAVNIGSIRDSIAKGIVMVTEDRKNQGLILDTTIRENVLFPNLNLLTKMGMVKERKTIHATRSVIEKMGVKGRPRNYLSELSGGNQQKIVIGKWLYRDPKVIILDEPTRGIDVGARSAIYDVIKEMADSGMAVVVVSSDLEEVLGLAHRVLVMSDGNAKAVMDRTEATPEKVMTLATT